MDDELTSICNTLYKTILNFLIDDDYKVDNSLEWSELCQIYIMRYRRIIGIFILIILLGILRYCNWKEVNESSTLQTGGGNHSALVQAEMAKLRAVDEAQTQFAKEKAEIAKAEAKIAEEKTKAEQVKKVAQAKAAKKAGRSTFSKAMSKAGKATRITGAASTISSAASSAKKSVREGMGKIGSHLSKDTYTGAQVAKLSKGVGSAIDKTKLGKLASGKMDDIKAMREAGMSRFGVAKQLTGDAANKFKEFAGWLYEILFALAISIAICMIVVPSIAFFALGLICYFLLRKKMSSIKAF